MTECIDPELRAIIKKVNQRTGIDLGQYKDNYITRRISTRLKALNIPDYCGYLKALDSSPGEYEKIVDAFTINVSEFFRDKDTYKVIRELVLPSLLREKTTQGRKIIRVWSAGCACGEEVHSISILLNDILGKDYDKFNISLYASDIDEACMKKAKEGIYDPVSFRNVEKSLIEKYTAPSENGRIMVKDIVKRNIHFRRHDLISGQRFGNFFDLILCRNVMIYFSEEQKRKLLMDFYSSLSGKGYLIIGKTETLVGDARASFEVVNNLERVYRKP
jgi:chemotaxis protein methyltransferase CheR